MNILLHAALNRRCASAVNKLLDLYGSKNSILIYCKQENYEIEKQLMPSCVIDKNELAGHRFDEFPMFNQLPPIDEDTLYAIALHEAETYKMMDSYYPPVNFNERQRIYLDGIRLFNGLIEKYKIEVYITFGIPHQVYDYMIYNLCKAKGIPTILLYRTPVKGLIYGFTDIDNHMPEFKARYERLKLEYKERHPDDIQLPKILDDVYVRYTKDEQIPMLYYMKKKTFPEKMVRFFSLSKQYWDVMSGISSGYNYLKASHEKRMIDRFIAHNAVEPDLQCEYFFVALHYQPEGTTSPMAGVFVNQLLMIQMISAFVPDNVMIYVKEHPNQGKRGGKNIKFYQQMLKMNNVRLVPTNYSTTVLMHHSIGIVTATGTIAFEAMFKGKPVINFGHYIYEYGPNMYSVRTLVECRDAVRSIMNTTINDCKFEAKLYLKTLSEFVFEGEFCIDDIKNGKDELAEYEITSEDSNNNIFETISGMIGQDETT